MTAVKDHERFGVTPTVRYVCDDEGLVLLETRSGEYSSFNPVGARVWRQIASGASIVETVEHLRCEYPDVDSDTIDRDVRAIVAELRDQGWIEVGRGEGSGQLPISASTTARDADPDLGFGRVGLLETLRAFAALLCVEGQMRLSRFRRVYDSVRDAPTNQQGFDPRSVRRICRAVDRASAFYVKRARCLQRSAVCVRLLRRLGVHAQLVLGVRTFPFEAHAWVEVEGCVVNDQLDYVGRFLVLDRI